MAKLKNPFQAIASDVLDENGEPKSFSQQLNDYAYERMPPGDMLLVAKSSREAGVEEAPDLPIALKQSTLRKVTLTHEIALSSLENLPEWLRTYPLALESLSDIDSLLLIADAKDVHGNDIPIALRLEKEHQQININEIASVHGKKNLAYLIENTVKAGKNIHVNERTGEWLQLSRLPLPELAATRLSELIIASEQGKRKENHSFQPAAESRKPAQITRDMVRDGIETGLIRFEENPAFAPYPYANPDLWETVCAIGDNWFYFADTEGTSPADFIAINRDNLDQVVDEVFAALETADFSGSGIPKEEEAEYLYYYHFLKENLPAAKGDLTRRVAEISEEFDNREPFYDDASGRLYYATCTGDGVWGVHVLDLDSADIVNAVGMLEARGIEPDGWDVVETLIGDIGVVGDFEPYGSSGYENAVGDVARNQNLYMRSDEMGAHFRHMADERGVTASEGKDEHTPGLADMAHDASLAAHAAAEAKGPASPSREER